MNAIIPAFFAALTILLLVKSWDAFWTLMERRQIRRIRLHERTKVLKAWKERPKAQIMKIGRIMRFGEHEALVDFEMKGWTEAGTPVPQWMVSPDGEVALGGYTKEELKEMVQRREEFE